MDYPKLCDVINGRPYIINNAGEICCCHETGLIPFLFVKFYIVISSLYFSFSAHRKTSENDGEKGDVGAEEGREDAQVVRLLPRVVGLLRVARERVEQRGGEHAKLEN